MKEIDWIEVEANMRPHNGKHRFDPETRTRLMEYKGVLFYLDQNEVWRRKEVA